MATIQELIARAESLDLREILENSFIDTQDELTKAQRKQMLRGERSTGKKIGKYKSKIYAEKKFSMNKLAGFGFKDLRLTGDFQKAILVDVRQSSIVFSSADSKTQEIVDREREDIFGLTPDSAADYAEKHLSKAANTRINKHLKGE